MLDDGRREDEADRGSLIIPVSLKHLRLELLILSTSSAGRLFFTSDSPIFISICNQTRIVGIGITVNLHESTFAI